MANAEPEFAGRGHIPPRLMHKKKKRDGGRSGRGGKREKRLVFALEGPQSKQAEKKKVGEKRGRWHEQRGRVTHCG